MHCLINIKRKQLYLILATIICYQSMWYPSANLSNTNPPIYLDTRNLVPCSKSDLLI